MSLNTTLLNPNRRRSSVYAQPRFTEPGAMLVRETSNTSETNQDDLQDESLYQDTSVWKEVKFISINSMPLILTFLMQYSLSMSSLFFIGNLCIDPETGSSARYLSSASLAVMTYNISGLAVIEGLSTSLDTFCSQAYGAKKYEKVGLYVQRCALMILVCLIPVMGLWCVSEHWMGYFIPQQELLHDIQTYLKIMALGVPGLIMFEAGKRFVQTQGYYNVSTYSLIGVLPINLVLVYVMTVKWGYKGAPIAIAISQWLMFFSLAGYCMFIRKETLKCWAPIFPKEVTTTQGFFKKIVKGVEVLFLGAEQNVLDVANNSTDLAQLNNSTRYGSITDSPIPARKRLPIFQNWKPMIELAWPGLVMIESEFLSYEFLTIFSTYLGGETEIAIQTVLASIGALIYQDIFATGCVISTRVAHIIGSYYHEYHRNKQTNPLEYTGVDVLAKRNAIKCIKACYIVAVALGGLNCFILYYFARGLAAIFTQDAVIIETSSQIMVVLAINQFPNSLNVMNNAILRGQGRQRVGGILNVISYYSLGLPLSYFFAFKLGYGLKGLWYGCTAGLTFLSTSQMLFVVRTDWDQVLDSVITRLDQEHQI